ncbi:SDR family NAD(P)-dependent oxidoreductase [Streptomyces sp. M19]
MGGSTGIGRGVADAWAAAGLDVVVLSRTAPIGTGAERLSWTPLDLTDGAEASRRLATAADGALHAVCFAAVHYGDRRALFAEVTEREWRRQLEVNLHGLWLTLSASLPALRREEPGCSSASPPRWSSTPVPGGRVTRPRRRRAPLCWTP